MQKLAAIISRLIEGGMTEQEIANCLAKLGTPIAQSTVHRIKTGEINQTKFDVGMSIVQLGSERVDA